MARKTQMAKSMAMVFLSIDKGVFTKVNGTMGSSMALEDLLLKIPGKLRYIFVIHQLLLKFFSKDINFYIIVNRQVRHQTLYKFTVENGQMIWRLEKACYTVLPLYLPFL